MGVKNTVRPEVNVYDVLAEKEVKRLVTAYLRKMNFSQKFIRFDIADAIQDIMERLICRAYKAERGAAPGTLIYMVTQSYVINLYRSKALRDAALTVHNDYICSNATYEDVPDFYEAEGEVRSFFADTNMSALDRLIEMEDDVERTRQASEHLGRTIAQKVKP